MRHDHPMKPATPDACCCGPDVSPTPAPSRRALLTASAGLAAGAAALPFLSDSARAQAAGANADGLLARVQGQRRILLKGGVVLTLDRGIGDFAQADVLIEDGKIRERPAERRNLERRRSGDRRHQPHRGAGLHRHASPFLPGPVAKHPHQRPAQSRLQSRHRQYAHAGLCARGCLCRRARHGARHDRHGHHHRRRHVAGLAYAGAQRRLHSCVAGVRHARGLRLLARQRTRHALPAGYRAAADAHISARRTSC